MTKALVKFDAPELRVIEKSKAAQIKTTFEPMAEMLAEFEGRYAEVLGEAEKEITKDLTGKARTLRIAISKVRIKTEKLRKEQKEGYLRAGKAVDGVSNILKWAVIDKENKLEEIEKHFQIQEQKRLEALQAERVEKISPYIEDAHERNLYEMADDVWAAYFGAKKREYEDRIEAEQQAAVNRLEREKAEAEERERIRKENEQLRKEAEERDRVEKIEQEKREAAAQQVREAHEAQLKIERDERERAESIECAKRVKLEAEIQAKEEAERVARKTAEAELQAELSKGDAEKVNDLLTDLENLKTKFTFKSAKNRKMYSTLSPLIDNAINHIRG